MKYPMLRKFLYGSLVLALALGVLVTTLTRLSSLSYAFSPTNTPLPSAIDSIPSINYTITLPGKVMPDSVLWPLKAARDRIWYLLTPDHLRKAELALFFSDKRVMSSKVLFEKNDAELGMTTLTKGEKYLETALIEEKLARDEGVDTSEFLTSASQASLKHREILQKSIIPSASEQARPHLNDLDSKVGGIFDYLSVTLKSMGKDVPNDPFERQESR